MTRKRLLVGLFALSFAIPIVLSYVAKNDDLVVKMPRDPLGWAVEAMFVLLFIDGCRGSTSSFNWLAGLFMLLGAGSLVGSFFAPNGPFQLAAAGLAFIASAIVILLLRSEIPEERRVRREQAGQRKKSRTRSESGTLVG